MRTPRRRTAEHERWARDRHTEVEVVARGAEAGDERRLPRHRRHGARARRARVDARSLACARSRPWRPSARASSEPRTARASLCRRTFASGRGRIDDPNQRSRFRHTRTRRVTLLEPSLDVHETTGQLDRSRKRMQRADRAQIDRVDGQESIYRRAEGVGQRASRGGGRREECRRSTTPDSICSRSAWESLATGTHRRRRRLARRRSKAGR